ncbi:glycosyltransferase [Flavobacterium sp. F-328]|uniref:Glycosyltransferase n=1 Tax=Flavobacterium erciyesense TaxID=2825842 RepID=A0ABS5D544_9FLAO|nr:glycosyltransferase [Flavobacterium erciyesense]MBQ0909152.1 glycosyltransferase [Flavobacterium erciyesense]
MITALLLYLILLIYTLAIMALIYGFTKIKTTKHSSASATTAFTIIVPFRNEAHNLPLLLDSFTKLEYPAHLFEVLLIDDASTDGFELPELPFKATILPNHRTSNSPKKDAITAAMTRVSTNWVITTDADCTLPKKWLSSLDQYLQNHNVSMVAGAVTYTGNNSFLHHFQQLDLTSLQGATIGSFGLGKGFMCNGANLAYTKAIFEELNGFEGNNSIASGDDVFLLQKAIARHPEKVHYLKSSNNIVKTQAVNSWEALFYQRVRWASKTSSYQSSFGKVLAVIVFLGNLNWIFILFLAVISSFSLVHLLIVCVAKFIVDTVLIYQTNNFLTKTKMRHLLASSLLYPFFSTFVALYSMTGKYEWKGRKF